MRRTSGEGVNRFFSSRNQRFGGKAVYKLYQAFKDLYNQVYGARGFLLRFKYPYNLALGIIETTVSLRISVNHIHYRALWFCYCHRVMTYYLHVIILLVSIIWSADMHSSHFWNFLWFCPI